MDFKLPPGAKISPQLLANPAQVSNTNPADSDYYAKQYPIAQGQEFGLAQCKAPCECIDCSDSWYTTTKQSEYLLFPYWGTVDDDTVERIIQTLTDESNIALEKLRLILESRGDGLISKWKKKSKANRAALIKSVAPHVAENNSALFNFAYSRQEVWLVGDEIRKRRAARWMLLLPWLNLETMSANPAALFALAHFRSSCSPAKFAAWDSRQLDLSWDFGHFDHEFSPKCAAMYEASYGKVVNWNIEQAHCGLILGFPRARLVFEAQRNLSQLLVNLVTTALGDTDLIREVQPTSQERWMGAAQAGFRRTTGTTNLWSELVSQTFSERNPYTHQAFAPAPALDIKYLCSLATTRKKVIDDHLYDLQSDVHYMRRHLKALKNATLLRYAPEAGGVVLSRYITFLIKARQQWHLLEEEFKHAQSIWEKHSNNLDPCAPLPEELNRALGSLELLCVNTVILHCKRLHEHTPYLQNSVYAEQAKPAAEKAFRNKSRATINNPKYWATPDMQVVFDRNRPSHFESDPLDWCLNEVLIWPDAMDGFDHTMLFAFLEQYLSDNKGAANRLDDVIMLQLSDLAVAHEMLIAIRHQRPRNTNPDSKGFHGREGRTAWQIRELDRDTALKLTVDLMIACQNFWDEFFIKSAMEVATRQTQKLEQARRDRQALELLWTAFGKHAETQYSHGTLSEEQMSALLAPISVVGTEEYALQIRLQEEAMFRLMRPSESDLSLSRLQLTPDSSTSSKKEFQIAPQPKQKTRPEQQKQEYASLIDDADELQKEAATPHQIQIHKQHLPIFARMFPHSIEEKATKTRWPAFVDAMYDAGCAVQNGSGSAVSFEDKLNAKGKVVLHKGHPDSDIDQDMMHVFGRRLKKWFGWRRECFVVEE